MIAEIIRKAALFCGKNRWIYAVTVTGIALLFFTTLFLFAIASQDNESYYDMNPYVNSQYTIQLNSAAEGDIQSVLASLSHYKENILEISLTGRTTIDNPNGKRSQIGVTAYYPENLSGFYVMKGTDSLEKDADQVLIEFFNGEDTVLTSASKGWFSSDTGDAAKQNLSHIHISGARTYDVEGFITSNNNSCPGSIVCNYDKYFVIVQSTDTLILQCSKVLTSEEEQSMINAISSVVRVKEITYPDMANKSIAENYKATLFMYFGIVFVCLLCSIQLIVYYLNLRDQELWVYRLLGISRSYMSGHVLATILAILVPGMLAGAGIFTLTGFAIPSFNLFGVLNSVGFRYVIAGFFCSSMLLIVAARTVQSFFVRKDILTEVRE